MRDNKDSAPARWGLDGLPVVVLSISSLLLDDSPRHGGENDEHIHVLAGSEEQLPPIVVHGPLMRVIDGRHRVRAVVLRGDDTIDAKVYHGTSDDAFVLAVRMNITHGLPLTRTERTTAALRIIGSHPQWSNRMITTATGLSAGTVGKYVSVRLRTMRSRPPGSAKTVAHGPSTPQ